MKKCLYILLIITLSSGNEDSILFQCDEQNIDMLILPLGIYCTITSMYIDQTTSVKFIHSSSNTEVVKFYDSRLTYIPNKIFTAFENIRDFDISNSGLIEINRHTFDDAVNLQYLNLSSNELTKLTDSILSNSLNLYNVDFSHNQIDEISEIAFIGLKYVAVINLAHNKLKKLKLGTFAATPQLTELNLAYNDIEVLENEQFLETRNMMTLSLNNNRLKKISEKVFSSSVLLKQLCLSHNELTSFANKYGIQTLEIENNSLTKLTVGDCLKIKASNNNISSIIVQNSTKIYELNLSRNKITDLKNITSMTAMRVLDLSFNTLGNINTTTFSQLKILKELSLQNTSLKGLNYGTFAAQEELILLDLSYNYLGNDFGL